MTNQKIVSRETAKKYREAGADIPTAKYFAKLESKMYASNLLAARLTPHVQKLLDKGKIVFETILQPYGCDCCGSYPETTIVFYNFIWNVTTRSHDKIEKGRVKYR